MKKVILAIAFLIALSTSAFSQGAPPFRLQEIDGSPSVLSPTVIKVTNGTLSCSGKTCTITISGGSGITIGTTAIASGTATRLLYETAGNVVGEISGATSDGTNLTTTSGALRATSPRITTSIFDANGLAIISLNPTASAVNSLQITNGATGSPGIVDLAAIGSDSNIRLSFTSKGTGGAVFTNASANGLVVGPNGVTNPTLNVVTNVASAATGLSITGNAAGSGVTLTVLTSGSNETMRLTPAGTGVVAIAQPGGTPGTDELKLSNNGTSSTIQHSDAAGRLYILSTNDVRIGTSTGAYTSFGSSSATFGPSGVVFSDSNDAAAGTRDVNFARSGTNTVRLGNNSTGAGNLSIGTNAITAPGTSGAGVFLMGLSTAPTSSPADTAQLWAADMQGTAGNHGFHMRNEINTAALILPGVRYKTDTGDPSDPFEGMMVINTFDNTFKVYAEAAWRTITTW